MMNDDEKDVNIMRDILIKGISLNSLKKNKLGDILEHILTGLNSLAEEDKKEIKN